MSLANLRQRLARLGATVTLPETRLPPHLLAELKAVWKARWPQQGEADWPRHLRVINKVMRMNSEQRAAMLAELDAKITAHNGGITP